MPDPTIADLLRVLPSHVGLTISHNAHRLDYETVEQHLAHAWNGHEPDDADEWPSTEERAKAIATGELWTCQWYPDTPVGFCVMRAATLDALIASLASS